jgi:hypothetical protein
MFEALLAMLIHNVIPFSLGLFFYVFSPIIKKSDARMADISRKSGLVMIIVVAIGIVMELLRWLF